MNYMYEALHTSYNGRCRKRGTAPSPTHAMGFYFSALRALCHSVLTAPDLCFCALALTWRLAWSMVDVWDGWLVRSEVQACTPV